MLIGITQTRHGVLDVGVGFVDDGVGEARGAGELLVGHGPVLWKLGRLIHVVRFAPAASLSWK